MVGLLHGTHQALSPRAGSHTLPEVGGTLQRTPVARVPGLPRGPCCRGDADAPELDLRLPCWTPEGPMHR